MKPIVGSGTVGWFSAGLNRRGVVFCGTFGFEQHAAHRWWRDLSEAVAGTGCAVMRFDYPGEGDSEAPSVQLEPALATIRWAVRFLREEAQVDEIVLIGLRFGGTLATLIASEDDIDRLVLLAPFARGRSFIREMEAQACLIDVLPNRKPIPKPAGMLSVGGFAINADLIQKLRSIDLSQAAVPSAKNILFLGPDPTGLTSVYEKQGRTVKKGNFPGLASLVSDSFLTRMDEHTRAQILTFVSDRAKPRASPPALLHASTGGLSWTDWTEQLVEFENGMFSILCEPRTKLAKEHRFLFINMGASVHSGYGRQTTTLARAMARNGMTSLRIDLRGVGDSIERPDGMLPYYNLNALEDVRFAVDWLTRSAARPIIVVGACNGAYLGFHAICRDERISAGILINLYCFDWELKHGSEPYAIKPIREISSYATMLFERSTWQRIFGGETPILRIICAIVRKAIVRGCKKFSRRDRPVESSLSIIERIRNARRRGAKFVMLYSEGDAGLIDLHSHFGSFNDAEAIIGEPIQIIAEVDHMFSAETAQAVLLREVNRVGNLFE